MNEPNNKKRVTPEELIPALRHYRHNTSSDWLFECFDYEETVKLVESLATELKKEKKALKLKIEAHDKLIRKAASVCLSLEKKHSGDIELIAYNDGCFNCYDEILKLESKT